MKEFSNNERKEICATCGGACCKTCPGSYHPDDLGRPITYDSLKELLLKGEVSVDWWFGALEQDNLFPGKDCFNYYLRPRMANTDIIDDCDWTEKLFRQTGCIHLTETGCNLPFESRPYGCKTLSPVHCGYAQRTGIRSYDPATFYDNVQSAIDWLPYREIIAQLSNELKAPSNSNKYTVEALYKKKECNDNDNDI